MSGVMEMAYELERYGLNSGPDKRVCSAHFTDFGIKSFIRRSKEKGVCDYCKRRRVLVSLEDLMKFLMETVLHYYIDPVNFSGYSNGEYHTPHEGAWQILQEDFELEVVDNDLFYDMENWIDVSMSYADRNRLYSEGQYLRPDSWSHFCYLVKHEVRYLFPSFKEEFDSYLYKPLQILKEIEKMINKYKMYSKLSVGFEVYRCRQHNLTEIIDQVEQICAPELQYCINPNRMSPAGISMFYCASHESTAKAETIIPSWTPSALTMVKFALKNDLTLIDLTKIPKSPSVFNCRGRKKLEDVYFLNSLVNDLTKPIARDGKVHIDYVPTQIVTEFFRYMLRKKVDGIIYPSSKDGGKNALVLFYGHWESMSNLEFLGKSLKTVSI